MSAHEAIIQVSCNGPCMPEVTVSHSSETVTNCVDENAPMCGVTETSKTVGGDEHEESSAALAAASNDGTCGGTGAHVSCMQEEGVIQTQFPAPHSESEGLPCCKSDGAEACPPKVAAQDASLDKGGSGEAAPPSPSIEPPRKVRGRDGSANDDVSGNVKQASPRSSVSEQ